MAIIPAGYQPLLNVMETQTAIKRLKDGFESCLAEMLHLTRVSAPLFVTPESGLNDMLNGVERPVSFDLGETPGSCAQIVQSLAKWKRYALQRYGFEPQTGLYTDMNAVRRDEITDNLHSYYVDQWDWELIIGENERTLEKLRDLVDRIYAVFLRTEYDVCMFEPRLEPVLPRHITFLTSQQLEDAWPTLTPKERERAACMKHGAVFIMQIGGPLRSGQPHDGRAPDYDDWTLNGDILFYYPLLDTAFEVSSMGIRVNAEALRRQLAARGCESWASQPFHRSLLAGELPQTAGGGIGQSRICMFFLKKAHIGEVQASLWPQATRDAFAKAGISLL
ncbi:MAG: aspartate--ammonia ligase [Christensenellales bacterium]|mgnify:CR=1 FL=1|uniref:Aspartate--ammonia ligase n=1 Tax=Candidatus Avichristensenella intestinipullorum TaxID=2840693 RepID=A0A9D0YY98_9FIRM|nr:aspartate--ammonia ligase [Christensenellales bacterium]HIQ63954.1 aspartate--ammonia ligase [Candidatus Avichristensenella intestinipullorum]